MIPSSLSFGFNPLANSHSSGIPSPSVSLGVAILVSIGQGFQSSPASIGLMSKGVSIIPYTSPLPLPVYVAFPFLVSLTTRLSTSSRCNEAPAYCSTFSYARSAVCVVTYMKSNGSLKRMVSLVVDV